MKKTQIKRILSLMLAVTVMSTGTICANAGTTVRANDGSEQNQVVGVAEYQPQIGVPFTDVTEQEARAFEESLESKFYGKDSKEKKADLKESAQKKAKAMVALYGETSIQYAMMQDGKLILSDCYGKDDKAKKTNVTTETMYGTASISKMFLTTAVMKLVDRGQLKLDEKVVTYLPEFTMADERYKDITVRMLLNHSSGIMGGGLSNTVLLNDADTYYHDEFLNILKKQHLNADPGAYSVYCNDGFMLAELVVERVSGKSFTQYLQDEVFTPLGLEHTKTPQQMDAEDATAGIYNENDKLPVEYLNSIAAAGVYSTAEDLCKYGMTYTDNQEPLLSDASIAATYEEEARKGQWCEEYSGSINYGLGWDSVNTYPFADYGIKAAEKGGDALYTHGNLMVFPEQDMAVAVLSSGGSSAQDAIFAQYLATEYFKEQGILTEEKIDSVKNKYETDKQEVPKELETYNGYYTSSGTSYKIKMTKTGFTLTNLSNKNTKIKFVYSGNGQFVYPGGVQMVSFMKQNGTKYMMLGSYSELPGIGTAFSYVYAGQKSANIKLDSAVKKAWQKRDGKKYFVVSEKYSSALYVNNGIGMEADLDMSQNGYFYNTKIVDENTSVAFTDIPAHASRDARDYVFETDKNGVEYLSFAGMRAISEDGIKNLSSKASFTVKINSTTGEAKWYKVSKKLTNKKMTVVLPKDKGAMVSVYDVSGNLKMNTYISGEKSIKLPKNGYVVFAGDKGAKIKVKIK